MPDLRCRRDDVGRWFVYVPVFGSQSKLPEPCGGQRSTNRLSFRAVRQIKGAAIKANNFGMGLRTFITFTVCEEHRADFIEGRLVLGLEMKRTLNAFSEWLHRRGKSRLVYIWVAENKNDTNPHVHLLTNYQVPRHEFDEFTQHVESLWGWGYAHAERIRKPESAGRYLMKALGYTMKGAADGQGTVIGNRYGIARSIMPRYETVNLYDCKGAANGLTELQVQMKGAIEELCHGVWLLPYGVSFGAGSEWEFVEDLLDALSDVAVELG
ncbi:MAG: hypothetical protein AB2L09_10970 [Coriobacteriia bacterium]